MPQITLDIPQQNLALLLEITDAMGILKEDIIISDGSPDWHNNILNERMEKYKRGEMTTTSWENFEKELNNDDKTDSLQDQNRDETKIDVKEARTHYQSILRVLSTRFTNDFKNTINKIKLNPFTFGYRFNEFRTANFAVFPYQVHYVIDKNSSTIIIFAVLNAYRNPQFVSSRLVK